MFEVLHGFSLHHRLWLAATYDKIIAFDSEGLALSSQSLGHGDTPLFRKARQVGQSPYSEILPCGGQQDENSVQDPGIQEIVESNVRLR
jgi:hypothetical protein